MGAKFWIKRFVLVLFGTFIVITAANIITGDELVSAVSTGLIWSVATTVVFIAARLYQSKRGQHCAVCKDTPEMQEKYKQ